MEEELSKDIMENKMVEDAFNHLIESYLSTKHRKKVEIITKAFNFAKHAHKGARRLSGEPYIMHPIAVAQIVCSEIGLGSTSICSALLHDVVEDTDYTTEDIENMFGPKIAQIVDGLTKISGGIFGERASAQAENFKKLLLTMNDDIRVVLIKMADRLHNMRTLGSQPENKRYKISGETLYIYAPLANRLGLNAIKSELENLAFKYEHPKEYANIINKLEATESERSNVFDEFTAPIRKQLDQMGIKYEIKARVKTPYSIWNKMQNKHIPFEEIYDILAVRIIFEPREGWNEKNECFNVYVAITQLYPSHPERLRDWVNHPKANGYQALHITLMSNKGEWIEVQIRSNRMDEIAEKGFAAHWKYKDEQRSSDGSTQPPVVNIQSEEEDKESDAAKELDKWLVTIKEILDDPQPDAMDFLDTIKLNLYASEILVFTPKGELRTLPAGATALDFAYTIHTVVGDHCIGAKVNHKLVPMSYVLQSGDQVEILTQKSQKVQKEWLDMVSTAKAKTKILSAIHKEEREQRIIGDNMLNDFFKRIELQRDTASIDKLCKHHGCRKPDDLYLAIGQEQIVLGDEDEAFLKHKNNAGWRRILSFGRTKKSEEVKTNNTDEQTPHKYDKKVPLLLTEDSLAHEFHLADCCQPIPGDSVMGYLDDDNVMHIHKLQCPLALRLKANYGNRIYSAKWQMNHLQHFLVTIRISGLDQLGLLSRITQVISHLFNTNIRKLEIETIDGIFEGKVTFYVHDLDEVNNIISNLKKIPDVKEVARM
ncbi:MAG: bifunctional (p)ppGpp synthetase/guanosine-3',5'-bis(diphosphate) 3'-pyrophosphohydrolase [Bacteroidaceae bacterium]|nr:bifunctional (p)ppGpp synthetase/guanosine-3',5'-bis(diphosphate) 3'-pyrophosphohydrolase [Bacteroidaceae bacterium]